MSEDYDWEEELIDDESEEDTNDPEFYFQEDVTHYDQHYKGTGKRRLYKSRSNKLETKRLYRLKNKDKTAQYISQYQVRRYRTDLIFRLRNIVSVTVRQALKKNKAKKQDSVLNHLDYTMQELRDHLEKQFDEHMSWENYGSYWVIDHIYPQSLLPYSSMEDDNFKKCWSLDNLRPLERSANLKKGNKIII